MSTTLLSAIEAPTRHTTSPIVTGTSILAIKYADGVMMAADTLGSYGNLARYTDLRRIRPVGPHAMIGAGGEISDYQYVSDLLDQLMKEDALEADGSRLTAPEIHSYLTRVIYKRRNKGDPLYNKFVVAGVHALTGVERLAHCAHPLKDTLGSEPLAAPEAATVGSTTAGGGGGAGVSASTSSSSSSSAAMSDEPSGSSLPPTAHRLRVFLGYLDHIGTSFEENFTATGYGAHLALPLIRERWRADLSEVEARTLLEDCMRILWYRDCRALNKIIIGKMTLAGCTVSEPYSVDTKWDFPSFVRPKAGVDAGGSW